jgi:probable HAF family extracellular repeat protein
MHRAYLLLFASLAAGCRDAPPPTAPDLAPEFAPGGKPGSGIPITDLGILPNRLTNKSSLAFAVRTGATRADVEVVGMSTVNCCNAHAFLWSPGGGISDLGTLLENEAGSSFAYDVSSNGTVVGVADGPSTGTTRGFVQPAGGVMQALSLLGSAGSSGAQAISENGIYIAGGSFVPSGSAGSVHAVRWTWNGTGWAIDSIGPGTAQGVSDAGTVVGVNDGKAVLWFNGGGSWTPVQLHAGESQALAINPAGTVVVGDRAAGAIRVPVSWSSVQGQWIGPVDLTGLGDEGQALSVNDIGDATLVVGMSRKPRGSFRAVLWRPLPTRPVTFGAPEDLGSLVNGGDARAFDINGHGQIAGGSRAKGSIEHAVLWTLP